MNSNLPKFAIFEDTLTNSKDYYFYEPIKEIIAYDKDTLESSLKELEILKQQDLYLAGYISYEASYYLNNKLECLCSNSDRKLLHFVAFKNFSHNIPTSPNANKAINLMMDNLSFNDYQQSFAKVQQALVDGQSYQINLTKNIYANTTLNSQDLYTMLKKQQPVKYAAYLPFLNPDIISISPELFFKKEATKLTVKPMKGTAKLSGNDVKDLEVYQELKSCDKNKAENLIIVDLLRNDLSGVAKTHTVKVDKLFSIEKYKDLLQMTSEVSAEIDSQISLRKILDSLFPCGSITGAPKERTMKLIKSIEKDNRGVYTGSIGYISPNNDMCFNVAIRTIQKYQNDLQIGVGGGITVYSDVESEWHEMDTKINFLKQVYEPDFSLIESIYYHDEFRNLDLHLERLKHSARRLYFDINISNIENQLVFYCEKLPKGKEYKIRLEYDYDGSIKIEHSQIETSNKQPVKLRVCPERINSKNKLFQYKSTHSSTRGFYTQMHNKYIAADKSCELIFLNEKNNITETRFHNIIIEKDTRLYTPKLDDGVLDGITRKSFIKKGKLQSENITLNELKSADKIYLINSVRGLIPAYLEA